MPRHPVHVIRVGKGLQGTLLVSYSGILLVVTLLVQGAGHGRTNLAPFEDIQRLVLRAGHGGYLSNAFLYAIVGIVDAVEALAGGAPPNGAAPGELPPSATGASPGTGRPARAARRQRPGPQP